MRVAFAMLAVAAVTCVGVGPARAGSRVAIVDATPPGTAAGDTVNALRGRLLAAGHENVRDPALRAALEAPLAPAEPSDAIERGRAVIATARDHFTGFEHDAALSALAEAEAMLAAEMPASAAREALADLQLLAAQIHDARGRQASTIAALRAVRRLAPDRTLDAARYKPELVHRFEAARKPVPTAQLAIATTPAGAAIWIDGVAVGNAPLTIDAAAVGRLYVTAVRDGAVTQTRIVEVDPGRENRLDLALPELSAAQRIERLRRALAGADAASEQWQLGAGEIARLAGADLVVLLRLDATGEIVAVLFRPGASALGRWQPASSIAAPVTSSRSPRSPAPLPSGPALSFQDTAAAPAPWYRQWWGQTLLLSGAAVVAGALVYGFTRESRDTYSLGGWCVGGNDEC